MNKEKLMRDDARIEALLRGDAAREVAELADDAAFSAVVLSRLPPPVGAVAPAVANLRPLLHLLSACGMGVVLAMLLVTVPDLLNFLSSLLMLESQGFAALQPQKLLPSLALLGLLCWWSWQQWREG